ATAPASPTARRSRPGRSPGASAPRRRTATRDGDLACATGRLPPHRRAATGPLRARAVGRGGRGRGRRVPLLPGAGGPPVRRRGGRGGGAGGGRPAARLADADGRRRRLALAGRHAPGAGRAGAAGGLRLGPRALAPAPPG